MTPAALTAAARSREHRRSRPPGPTVPRRVSGPMAPRRAPAVDGALALSDAAIAAPRPRISPRERTPVASPPLRLVAGGAAIAVRVGETAVAVSASRTMDRLVRSRAWIVIIGFALIGIVAMQVSMLRLNSGIANATDDLASLQRSNQSLKATISQLSSGDRIQGLAAQRGFIMPQPADLTYLQARTSGAAANRAAQRMQAPDRDLAGPAGSLLVAPPAADAPSGDATTATTATTPAAQQPVVPTTIATTATTPAQQQQTPQQPVAPPAQSTATTTAAGGTSPQTGVTLP